MALNQEDIDVGAAPNDGQGDPIRTAFIKCNDNFTQLYSLPNPTPPATLIGAAGDIPGMYAYDDTYFYYCYEAYNGVSTIWGQLVQSDEAIPSIGNGLSNVVIAFANANVTVGVNGTGNVGVFSPAGLAVRGAVTSNTITTGSLVSGNFTITGDTISSLGEVITITPAGNVVFGDVVVNSSFNILGPRTTTESKIIVVANTAANLIAANLSGIQVGQANYASFLYNTSNAHWYASGNITANGYHVNGGNINGAFNINISNTLSANSVFVYENVTSNNSSANHVYSNTATIGTINANIISGDGSLIRNITGANVVGAVAIADFAVNSNAAGYSTFANVANTVSNLSQPNIVSAVNLTTVGTLTSLSVAGDLSGTNGFFSNTIVATQLGRSVLNPAGPSVLQGQIGANSNVQPNIIQVGSLTSLTVTGNIQANEELFVVGNVYAGNIFGNLSGIISLAEYVTRPNQSNITGLGILNSLTIANGGVISGANLVSSNFVIADRIFANIIGDSSALIGGKFGANSNAQPNVTSLGNLVSLNVNGGANFGTSAANTVSISGNTISTGGPGTTLNLGYNVIIPGNLQVQGNTTTVNSNVVAINDLTFVVANNASTSTLANGAGLFVGPEPTHYAGFYYISVTNSWNMDIPLYVSGNINSTANINGAGVTSTGNITSGAAITAVGNINSGASINAAGNIYAPSFNWSNGSPVVSTSGALSVSNINSTGNIASSANINAAGATFTGNVSGTNISVTGNVNGTYFNGIATSAQYADLAENYLADEAYAPGTVLSYGGVNEVTISLTDADSLVAGVVSTNPAYLMNSKLHGKTVVPIAFAGRVPCRVEGPITRGSMLVSNGDGRARAESNPAMGTVIGKALESFDGEVGVIEIVVGKL
jgi:hypothetical protein